MALSIILPGIGKTLIGLQLLGSEVSPPLGIGVTIPLAQSSGKIFGLLIHSQYGSFLPKVPEGHPS